MIVEQKISQEWESRICEWLYPNKTENEMIEFPKAASRGRTRLGDSIKDKLSNNDENILGENG